MLTSTAWWWKSAAFGLAGLALLLPLVWLLPAPMFRRSRRAVVMGASLFWPAFGVVLSQTMWDGYYRFFYPDWVKWAIPVLAFGVYPLLAFGYHWLASRLPG